MRMEIFKAIDWYVNDPLEPIDAPGDIAVLLETQGICLSAFIEDGTCIGCGGILFWGDNTAEACIRISKKGLEYKRQGLKAIKAGFAIIMRTCRNIVVFCWVDDSWPEAQRLTKWLGFTVGEELRELNGRTYRLWELKNGNDFNGVGNGSVSCGTDATGSDDAAASRSPSPNIRI